ncbi:hypothetical protein Baya_5050 [Bagarius yarrelli]|uniref:Uncharacterized protein n=1 Tax=Bagarius yarrelli TaxID=175774 RepID=A0A556TVD0_BAGYA|nr:hypothetical protein Baya_5050 [Bagarius yarrelli]
MTKMTPSLFPSFITNSEGAIGLGLLQWDALLIRGEKSGLKLHYIAALPKSRCGGKRAIGVTTAPRWLTESIEWP